MKKYLFEKNGWENDFSYAYSHAAKSFNEFIQEGNAVVSTFNKDINDYDYISIVHAEKQRGGAKISVACSFDSYGAPLITLASSLEKDGEHTMYGEHYEVVFYENGCNVWHILKAPEGYHKKCLTTKVAFLKFPIEGGELINAEIEVGEKKLIVKVKGEIIIADAEHLKDEFYLGVTACEGINRFYSLEIK